MWSKLGWTYAFIVRTLFTVIAVGDYARNDDVYEELDKQHLHEVFREEARRTRSKEEMEAECLELRKLFFDDSKLSM